MKNTIFAIAILGEFIFTTASAGIWYVHPDSTLNAIQAALDSCSANDTVLVGPGTYYENIVWPNTQGIDLVSAQGPLATIIDGDSIGRVITITTCVDSFTMVKGFTIRRGFTSGMELGGGMLCDSSSPYICENNITQNIAANYSLGGAGIACVSHAMPVINDNIISNNKTPFGGGGILCLDNSNARITNNFIADNLAWMGGGILCWYLSSPSITGNTISGNVCYYDTTTDDRPRFAQRPTNGRDPGRCPSSGGGICCFDYGSPLISNNVISGNAATDGGGISMTYSNALIRDNIISGNTAGFNLAGFGGGIFGNSDSLVIINNTITGNAAELAGGGIFLFGGFIVIDSCTISDNVGDGVRCDYFCYAITVNNSNISGNAGYGVRNTAPSSLVLAEYNWWGDSTGPYHPTLNPGGLGDSVSDYVDFDPWLYHPWGVEEQPTVKPVQKYDTAGATIISGPLPLPAGKKCRVFDIMGRIVEPAKTTRGVYFIEIDGEVTRKVVKIK